MPFIRHWSCHLLQLPQLAMIVLLIISIIHLLEAWLEQVVISLKNPYVPEYSVWNRREHFRSAVLAGTWLFSAIAVALYYQHNYWILPALIVNRRIFFDYLLIIFRDRPRRQYEGNDWWTVNIFRRIFGTNGRMIELGLCIGVTIFSIFKSLLW